MIFVKNSKNSQIFANFGCFAMFRVKKWRFVVRKSFKRPTFSFPPLCFTAKLPSDFVLNHQAARYYGTLWKHEILDQDLKCSHFDLSTFFRGSLHINDDLEKCSSLLRLKGLFFDEPSGCTSKLCNSFFGGIMRKRERKGLFKTF